MTPEQVVGGWLLRPEVWQNEPMIYIKNAELRHLLRLPSSYACLTDLFDGQNYRLQEFWKGGQKPHMKMTSLERLSWKRMKGGIDTDATEWNTYPSFTGRWEYKTTV